MPKMPALAARESRKAKTMRTPAAPPRVGRRRWGRILALRNMGFHRWVKSKFSILFATAEEV
jgi:hypothetical protein